MIKSVAHQYVTQSAPSMSSNQSINQNWTAHALGLPGTFSRHRLQRKPLVSDPGMYHGTWCMSGLLTRSDRENVPGIPGAYANCTSTYLARSCIQQVVGPPNHKYIYIFLSFPRWHCDDTSGFNHTSWKTRTHLSYTIKIILPVTWETKWCRSCVAMIVIIIKYKSCAKYDSLEKCLKLILLTHI